MKSPSVVVLSLLALGLVVAAFVLLSREPSVRAPRPSATTRARANEAEKPARRVRADDEVVTAAARAGDGADPNAAAKPAALASDPPKEWPPQRAFTERCRARGGACPAGCTELAGGRCLDPCFIHTAECSRDCRLPDGTCGFPPPDNE